MCVARRRWRLGLAALLAAGLAACASPQLKQLEADVSALSARVAPDPPPSGGRLGWRELSRHAQAEGPGFLRIGLNAARSESALDARRQGRRPQVSLLVRSRLSALSGSGDITSSSTAGLGLEYDLASALLGFDDESIALTQDLIEVQKDLQSRQALIQLLNSYAAHAELHFELQEARLAGDGLQCDLQGMETQIALGRAPPDALRLIRTRIEDHRRATQLLGDQIQLLADRVLAQSGFETGHRIATRTDGLPAASAQSLSPASCYAGSGALRRDEILLKLSELALAQAEISRFTQISALLPTQIDPERGLNLDLLLAWVVPLIDQGETRRRVLDARLDLLALALSARSERLGYETLVSDARTDLATSRLELLRTESETERSAPAEPPTGAALCRYEVDEKLDEIRLRRLQFQTEIANARLAIACGQ